MKFTNLTTHNETMNLVTSTWSKLPKHWHNAIERVVNGITVYSGEQFHEQLSIASKTREIHTLGPQNAVLATIVKWGRWCEILMSDPYEISWQKFKENHEQIFRTYMLKSLGLCLYLYYSGFGKSVADVVRLSQNLDPAVEENFASTFASMYLRPPGTGFMTTKYNEPLDPFEVAVVGADTHLMMSR